MRALPEPRRREDLRVNHLAIIMFLVMVLCWLTTIVLGAQPAAIVFGAVMILGLMFLFTVVAVAHLDTRRQRKRPTIKR